MNVSFISYEYPPDTADGGIATYVHQAARMLQRRGHHVEVFTASPSREGVFHEDDIVVHRVIVEKQHDFADAIADIFSARHQAIKFDVLEGPDYCADARKAIQLAPELPFILKLHTPSIILLQTNFREPSLTRRFRMFGRSLICGERPYWGYAQSNVPYRRHALGMNQMERQHALRADEIAAPSKSLGRKMIREWRVRRDLVHFYPYPFTPSAELLSIPIDTHTERVTFIGRLEPRKGVVELARAIPLIAKSHPRTRFRFVGPVDVSPDPSMNMRQYLEHRLTNYRESVEFTGCVPPESIPDILGQTDLCVFPSLWENFPNVCLEAMAAARGIVGSNAGGMAEMLNTPKTGTLVPPRNPRKIALAVIDLLQNPKKRMRLGQAARQRVLEQYSDERIGTLQEESYRRAIANRQARNRESR